MAIFGWKPHLVDVYVQDPGLHYVSVLVDSGTTRRHYCDVFMWGEEDDFAERRVTGSITITEKLPNTYYGFSEFVSSELTLDNTDNPFPFMYVLNNRQQTLQPSYRQQHTGKYPLELKFDNGMGQTVRKVLSKGDFKVAVGLVF